MSELKPCPFCGGRTIMDASPDLDGYMEYRVECCKVYCLAHGPTRQAEAEAIAAFTMPEAVSAAVQAEREACAKIALNETPGVYDNTDESEGFARACHRIAELIRSRPAPAVDVLGVVREFVAVIRARSDAKFTRDEWNKFDALAALVPGAAAKGEGGE